MIRRSRLPLTTLALGAITVTAYLAELAAGGMAVCEELGFTPAYPSLGTALTSMLLHDPSTPWHVVGNLLVLAVVGAIVEPESGGSRLLALFVASGLGGALMHLVVSPGSDAPLVGMSGGLCGLMTVAAVLQPRAMLPFVVSYIGMNLIGLFIQTPLFPAGTSLASHVGGFIVGTAAVVVARARGLQWVTA